MQQFDTKIKQEKRDIFPTPQQNYTKKAQSINEQDNQSNPEKVWLLEEKLAAGKRVSSFFFMLRKQNKITENGQTTTTVASNSLAGGTRRGKINAFEPKEYILYIFLVHVKGRVFEP